MSADSDLHLDHDHRGSWLPTGRMIAARFTELRRRRGLMIALTAVTVGIPTVFLAIRLILHAVSPTSYGPAGGSTVFEGLVLGVLYIFGFIMAATLGSTAGSIDLTEGMFRHHVITGRSRIALYLARIPAGLAIILPLVAIGFAVVCTVSTLAAPTTFSYQNVNVPMNLSKAQFERWASDHATVVVDNFAFDLGSGGRFSVAHPCMPSDAPPLQRVILSPGGGQLAVCTPAELRTFASEIAAANYANYSTVFLAPSTGLMVKTGLWIELEAIVGFAIGLGLASLIGQRTVAVILLVILEIVVTPIAAGATLPHMINLQRGIIGVATARLEPSGLHQVFGGSDGGSATGAVSGETILVASLVVVGWILGWTVLGAWRMARRDV